ncbi:hypothetical protein CYMTET_46667 [Cymbomonas tetramitiformis]|uniref:Uncharacterized protein n=1 Tax=Cymbomonas tetramitiformis TaxID=36881 RepID=A0AAE0BX98_9CHLO|nr:hypothetical protein CYMTET_46667 [Cymbomonas tetramitiformis]
MKCSKVPSVTALRRYQIGFIRVTDIKMTESAAHGGKNSMQRSRRQPATIVSRSCAEKLPSPIAAVNLSDLQAMLGAEPQAQPSSAPDTHLVPAFREDEQHPGAMHTGRVFTAGSMTTADAMKKMLAALSFTQRSVGLPGAASQGDSTPRAPREADSTPLRPTPGSLVSSAAV